MITWIIGLAGSGKTSIGREVHALLKQRNPATVLLDGDQFRNIMGEDLGHGIEERRRNGWRMARMCAFLDEQNIDVVCCILSLFPDQREWCRRTFNRYFEVYVDVPMDELIRRDQKGLYSRALAGKIENVAGVDIPFPPPEQPDLIISNVVPRTEFRSLANNIVDAMNMGTTAP
jgi:cytidine diphosphoramidate kinase